MLINMPTWYYNNKMGYLDEFWNLDFVLKDQVGVIFLEKPLDVIMWTWNKKLMFEWIAMRA